MIKLHHLMRQSALSPDCIVLLSGKEFELFANKFFKRILSLISDWSLLLFLLAVGDHIKTYNHHKSTDSQ